MRDSMLRIPTEFASRSLALEHVYLAARQGCRKPSRYENFAWHFTVTLPSKDWKGLTGRVTDCVPDLIDAGKLRTHHFHLVGNGEMVHLMRMALHRAGMSPGNVSIETYFNHHVEPREAEVDKLAVRFLH